MVASLCSWLRQSLARVFLRTETVSSFGHVAVLINGKRGKLPGKPEGSADNVSIQGWISVHIFQPLLRTVICAIPQNAFSPGQKQLTTLFRHGKVSINARRYLAEPKGDADDVGSLDSIYVQTAVH